MTYIKNLLLTLYRKMSIASLFLTTVLKNSSVFCYFQVITNYQANVVTGVEMKILKRAAPVGNAQVLVYQFLKRSRCSSAFSHIPIEMNLMCP